MCKDKKIKYKLINKENLEIILFTLTIISFLYRSLLPSLRYPFLILYIVLINTVFIHRRNLVIQNFIKFIKVTREPLILYFIIILSIINSNKFYLLIFKDFLNISVLFSLIFVSFFVLSEKYKLDKFIYLLINYSVILVIVVLGIYVFNPMMLSDDLTDYNFKLIPCFIAYFGLLYYNIKHTKLKVTIFSSFVLLAISFFILLSGSRRGTSMLITIQVVFIFSLIINQINKKSRVKNLIRLIKYYFSVMLVIIMMLLIISFYASYEFKYKAIDHLSAENTYITKQRITSKIFRYINFFNLGVTYEALEDRLWSHDFNPLDPASGWGKRIHKVEYPLKGTNNDIIPVKARGYLMDSTCNASSWNNNAFSYSKFFSSDVDDNDKLIASVYCYVSKDFNGTWVRLRSEGSCYGNIESSYDLRNKGVWQKLSIEPVCKRGRIATYLYFAKYGVTDFSSLKGYVIFAYPTYKILNENDSITYDASKGYIQLLLNNGFEYKANEYSLSKAALSPLLKTSILLNISNGIVYSDPIRNWIKRLVNEDTTYYRYQADIHVEYDPKNSINGRTARWKFAWEIFTKEYNWKQKIFGNGFDYLNWYGYYFYNDKTKSDYPHNPFLSVLLYSGILGLLLYFILMFKVISIYLRYIKEYYILFIFFGITFFFSLFSANGPFSPPIMGFFVLLPFFIDYIHKKNKSV